MKIGFVELEIKAAAVYAACSVLNGNSLEPVAVYVSVRFGSTYMWLVIISEDSYVGIPPGVVPSDILKFPPDGSQNNSPEFPIYVFAAVPPMLLVNALNVAAMLFLF